MRVRYPRSFLKLLFVGFALVALPLILALVHNAVTINRLADQSQRAVYQAAQATQASRALTELITGMERMARQYAVLGDAVLLEGYARAHQRFDQTARQLSGLPLTREQQAQLEDIVGREARLFQVFSARQVPAEQVDAAAAEFAALADLARTMTAHSNDLIDREVDALQDLAGKAQSLMVWQLLALIPVALFLVVGFTFLIAWPIQQIEQAIRHLGDARFATPVEVTGPEDLESVGRQLDWLRRRLAELEEQKARFLRHVSHELKTPLTALREGSELLAEQAVGPLNPEQREIVRILQDNSVKLRRLIEDLLSYSAVQFQQSALQLKPVKMDQVVAQVVRDQKLALVAKDLRLQTDCAPVTVVAEEEKIRVVVDNLLSNAIKFSPRGASIHVSVRAEDGQAVLDVVDAGPGVAPHEREKVFDPFYQGEAAGSGPVKGTGLGLSIVREHVNAHRGRVEILDDAPGAHFRVRLPLQQSGASA